MSHQLYNDEVHEYIQTIQVDEERGVEYDLTIIEFDDHGTFWKLDQLESTLDLIEQRNAESERGILVIPFVHGWKNNADPDQEKGNLVDFRNELASIASSFADAGEDTPDRVVGVYLGWRGATSRVWLQKQTTFFSRKATAERVASLSMRETLFRLMSTTRARPESKCFVVGHSMGGLIVARTLAPSMTTLVLTAAQGDGAPLPADFVVMLNPALDALASWQFIDFLKRSNVRLELRTESGEIREAPGPIIVSITSEADRATGSAYPFGRTVGTLFTAFRSDHEDPQPSQRHLVTHAEGHVDYLVSHRARVEDGKVILERVPDAFNDTPFWVVQVTSEISADHNDTRNPMMAELIAQISRLNGLYETDVEVWMRVGPADESVPSP